MIRLKLSLLFVLLFSFTGRVMAQSAEQEANLKAAFIYNFTHYIDWDVNADQPDFTIGVMGSSKVTDALIEIAKTNTVNNKKITVRVFNRPEDISTCNILFIAKKSNFPLSSILDKAGRGVLTISEEPGLAKQGTVFNFILVADKLKFEVNLKSVYLSGLKVSSQLLKLATIVD